MSMFDTELQSTFACLANLLAGDVGDNRLTPDVASFSTCFSVPLEGQLDGAGIELLQSPSKTDVELD
jgi:hypothetical protein